MKMNVHPIQTVLTQIYNYFSKERSIRYVRSLQAILISITVIIVTFSLLFPTFVHFEIDLWSEGPWGISRNAPEEIIALTGVEFLLEEQYKSAQEQAARQAPLHFIRNFESLGKRDKNKDKTGQQQGQLIDKPKEGVSFSNMLDKDIVVLRKCRVKNKNIITISSCAANAMPLWRNLNKEDWENLLHFSSRSLAVRIRKMVNAVFENYVILQEQKKQKLSTKFSGHSVRVANAQQDADRGVDINWKKVISYKQLYNDLELRSQLNRLARSVLTRSSIYQQVSILKLSRSYIRKLVIQKEVFRYDETKTNVVREKSHERVALADYVYQVKRGEVIVNKGDVITENIYRALQVHQSNRSWEILRRLLSIVMQQFVLLFLVLYFVTRYSYKSVNDINSNLIIFITLWLFALTLIFFENLWAADIKVNEVTHFFGSWVPMGIFSILLVIVLGEKLSIPLLLYMSFITFTASKYEGISLLTAVTISLAGIILGKRIKKRVHFIRATMVLTFLSIILVIIGYLYNNRDIFAGYSVTNLLSENFISAIWAASLSGMSTMIVLGILPIYETIFNIPTRFKLIELADTSHPLLRELFQKGPSTWTHTMMVAALAEKACDKLNLNSVLARTGIYFHDIGKMVNAGFFIENQHLIPKPENIDKDNPAQAAKVVIAHVTDGIKMAEAARLPKEVIAFIPEHHGTSTMSFFYHKALQKSRRRVNKEDFQYKGPLPQTKETAIAMIADSVEAASRSIDLFTKESIYNLIQKIINAKVAENQFDECNLTIKELQIIKEAFAEVLLSSFHTRPKYPDKQHTAQLESQRNNGKKSLNSKRNKVKHTRKKTSRSKLSVNKKVKKTTKKASKKAAKRSV